MLKKYLIFILFVLSMIVMQGQEKGSDRVIYSPIGVFHSDYTPETGAPRQGILSPAVKGRIEIYPEYQKALAGLELFEHIIVIYHLDKSRAWHHTARPPASNPAYTFGLFATRSPNRPNPIGIATIKLEKIKKGILYVSGIDAFEGTPVLDIKPYLPSIDCITNSKNKIIEKELGLDKPK